ncbi:hypothetical protein CC86DRAFT_466043 [Ophiobolus disseminans]|uniref:DUF7708 domain-containing protein n=1 Tax=Ophiobolus disseminans TaxID=1469910 RepID=A0A6A7A1N2_9PLEO|nr:hypothetical protein CC86DRAFT_466043 [Ophiobolus disseminans]
MVETALAKEIKREDAFAELLNVATYSSSSSNSSITLKVRCQELEVALSKFRTLFDEKLPDAGSMKVVSLLTLGESVLQVKTRYEANTKRGLQVKMRFHSVCQSLNNHSNILKMLPHGEKYTSLICGSLETIVKASVNHEEVGEHFATARNDIDTAVAEAQRELKSSPDPFLLDLGIQMCCKILEFVTFFFSWYTKKGSRRLLASFNENLSKDYKPYLEDTQKILDFMRWGYQLCVGKAQMAKVEQYHAEVKSFQQQQSWSRNEEQWTFLNQVHETHNLLMHEKMHQILANIPQLMNMPNQQSGKGIRQILSREAEKFVADRNEYQGANNTMSLKLNVIDSPERVGASSISSVLRTKRAVDEASRVLDPFFDYGHMRSEALNLDCFIEADVVQTLQTWNSQTKSSILGIFGPATISQDCSTMLMTIKYVEAARAAGVPCVSYFCERSAKPPPAGRAPQTIGAVALLYALIKQLVLHLPLGMLEPAAITKDRFDELDGTLKAWPSALTIFRDLLKLAEPFLLLIVIYGIEMLDYEATQGRLVALIEELRAAMVVEEGAHSQKRLLKVLFATSGFSEVLKTSLKTDEICDMNRGSAAHSPGQSRKGRQSMGGVVFD